MKNSIIICAYNEEKTVENVVTSCCKFNPNAEIIVVDDGSVDNTGKILKNLSKNYNFKYEKLKKNKGKSRAMVRGVEISTGEIITFFDADVSNIKKEHFDSLLTPIFNNEADMILGQPSDIIIDYRINPFNSLTGERTLLKKDILPILDDIKEIRFGVETYINLFFKAHGKKIKYVTLNDLKHPTKYQKTTMTKATKEFIKEGQEIALTLIKNNNLILKRIRLEINAANEKTIKHANKTHNDLKKKLKKLKNKFYDFFQKKKS